MNKIPLRDINGQCEGECRDLVQEADHNRQRDIDSHPYSGSEAPSVPWANSRSEQPGFLGGHV